jgi:hypothetical protein
VVVCYNFAEGLTNEEEDRFLALDVDLFAVGTMTLPQPGLAKALTLADGDVVLPLQQTQDDGIGQAVEVQQEVAEQTKVTKEQLPYLTHFYTFIERDIAVDDLLARIKILRDQMKVAA